MKWGLSFQSKKEALQKQLEMAQKEEPYVSKTDDINQGKWLPRYQAQFEIKLNIAALRKEERP